MSADEHKDLIQAIHELALQIAIVKQKQDDNHNENKSIIKILSDKMSKLPCDTHIEKLKQYEKHMADGMAWRGIVVAIIIAMVGYIYSAVAWSGGISTSVERNKQEIDHCCKK
jgi:hypothetical protein